MIEKLIERIREERGKILVISHEDPDGDAVGSGLGLYLFLKKIGKDVDFVLKDPVPQYLDFLPGLKEIKNKPDGPYSLTLIVDASGIERAGFGEIQGTGDIARIDHHKTGENYSNLDFIDSSMPSCSLLILKLIKSYDENLIDPDIATLLYTALSTDTGSFRYLNSDSSVFEEAAYLVKKGAHPGEIARLVYQRKTLGSVKIQAKALNSLKLALKNRVAYVIITQEDLKETKALPEETSGIANLILSIRGVLVGIKFLENHDHWKISFRGKGFVDLAEVAEKFGGGGHKNAAGCRIYEKSSDRVVKMVLDALEEKILNLAIVEE